MSASNSCNFDVPIDLHLTSFLEKVMKREVSDDKVSKLTRKEQKALTELKNSKTIRMLVRSYQLLLRRKGLY